MHVSGQATGSSLTLGGHYSITFRSYYKTYPLQPYSKILFALNSAIRGQGDSIISVRGFFETICGSGQHYYYLHVSLLPEYGTWFREKPFKCNCSYKNALLIALGFTTTCVQ